MSRQPADQSARERALDPRGSFIVQAPAGSGKTELLTRRFLRLLATVAEPEEIVAVTFTRKAAAEMRHRILTALELAAGPEPDEAHRKGLWRLGKAAKGQDAKRGWELTRSPARLRVQTIDSLCAALARQMPVLSRFGAIPDVTENAEALYGEAAQRTLGAVDEDPGSDAARALGVVYRHLDGDLGKLEELLVAQLARRDQWLRLVAGLRGGATSRAALEAGLERVVGDHLTGLQDAAPAWLASDLPPLVRGAAERLKEKDPQHPLSGLADLEGLPGGGIAGLPLWRGLADFLLTQGGGLRKRVTVSEGFPPGKDAKEDKACMLALLEALGEESVFVDLLAAVRTLPATRYSDAQWEVVEALVEILRRAAAELQLVFADAGQVDFIEVAQAALRALGEEEAPTDLALRLDYQVRHLLVDEFQDTSLSQFQLLRRLTAGWEAGDGRTLFAVGDPMQSIYRFREAEVGLFLQAKHNGVGPLPVEPLTLSENFRSQSGIVDWVNQTFKEVLPPREDPDAGAVPFARSTPFHGPGANPAVSVHPLFGNDRTAEGALVAELVRSRLEGGSRSIAVLGRSRSHLAPVAAELGARGIRFRAVDTEPLSERPVVQDLLALTRALAHPGDRLAWLAVLRAPWCGIALADLLALAWDGSATLWDRLWDTEVLGKLSPSGRERVGRLAAALEPFVRCRRRNGLRRWVEGAWLALGGAATAGAERLGEAEAFCAALEGRDCGGALLDVGALEEDIEGLYAPPDPAAGAEVQLMTMHKAKGLQFDTVILTGLGRRPRSDTPPLLRAIERPRPEGSVDLLVAPIRDALEGVEPIYEHLGLREKGKGDNEVARLLYVACTRACSELHLVGHTKLDGEGKLRNPEGRSLLYKLWPAVAGYYEDAASSARPAGSEAPQAATAGKLRRLPLGWRLAELPASPLGARNAANEQTAPEQPSAIPFDWASPTAAPVGTLVHRYLQRMSLDGLDAWDADRLRRARPSVCASLRGLGLSGAQLEEGCDRVEQALFNVLGDRRARWILDPNHSDARSEYRLAARIDGEIRNVAVDRTFAEGGVRWIIDYKTGSHEGGDLEQFLKAEQERYTEQLETYARVFSMLGARRIRLGLYFPVLRAWVEWSFV
jgi:ATP-dependent helicase/nuclease subunit A